MKTTMKTRTIAAIAAIGIAATALAGCASDADVASENLSTAAEQFEIQRRITVVNTFTGIASLEVEGRCSAETADSFLAGAIELTCKIGPNEYVKHFAVRGDNDTVVIQQLETVDVSLYHHRVVVKPENLLPEFDYEGGEQ